VELWETLDRLAGGEEDFLPLLLMALEVVNVREKKGGVLLRSLYFD
jgi:hypothetical protein